MSGGRNLPPICSGCGTTEMVFCRESGDHYCDVCSTGMAAHEALLEELARLVESWRVRRRLTRADVNMYLSEMTDVDEEYAADLFNGVRRSALEFQVVDERLCA